MPGLIGFTKNGLTFDEASAAGHRMQDLLTYGTSTYKDSIFCDDHLCATRSDSRIFQKEKQPYQQDGVYVWLDGEFYNRKEMAISAGQCDGPSLSDAKLLTTLYVRDQQFKFLQQIDGIYAAVIYDSLRQKLHLISDRYGLRHLFWSIQEGQIVWTSELKGMLGVAHFTPRIDQAALQDFLGIGHLLGNRTWFDGVQVLAAATVLTRDLKTQTTLHQTYWGWDQVKPLSENINEEEVLEELSNLFVAGVSRRCDLGVGLTLSGGLDSRAILAAMPNHGPSIHAATFGKAGCDDVALAAAASRVKGAAHHIVEINADNWLRPRIGGVWCTDGHLDVMHMHIMAVKPKMKSLFRISLDGFLGDAVIGGGYGSKSQMLEKLDTRARRFIVLGSRLLRDDIESRFPFFDNRFLELAMSLPESWLKNSRMYRKMLLGRFPEYFETIPWQKTGSPIRYPDRKEIFAHLYSDAEKRLGQMPGLWRLAKLKRNKEYENYSSWMRGKSSRPFIEKVLLNPDALYVNYLSRDKVQHEVRQHMRGDEYSESIGRNLTFEIWLQQVFESRFRQDHDYN